MVHQENVSDSKLVIGLAANDPVLGHTKDKMLTALYPPEAGQGPIVL
jgi:hypothetical protein